MNIDAGELAQVARADEAARFNLYTDIHKGLRALLTDSLLAVGRMDPQDAAAVAATTTRVARMLDFCAAHLQHEDRFIHPAIEARAPGAAAGAAHDHREHEQAIAALRALTARLGTTPAPGRAGVAHALYLQLSRFVAHNLEHMHTEETAHNAALWAHYSDAELVTLHDALVATIPPEEMMFTLSWMLPAQNPAERAALLSAMQAGAPAPVFAAVLDLARTHLPAADWQALQQRLGAAASA